ncbi:hypothetical protein [Sphingobium ummariense]
MDDEPLPYHARFLDHGKEIAPEDAGFDSGLKKILADLYDRQRMESLRLYNNTARPAHDIDVDMAALDIAHEEERDRYIRDFHRADDLRRVRAEDRQARAQDQDRKLIR